MTRPRFELGSLKTTNRHLTCKEMDHLSKRLDYFSPILGPVAQWIRHLTTNQGIPGSSPGRIGSFDLSKINIKYELLGATNQERMLKKKILRLHIGTFY